MSKTYNLEKKSDQKRFRRDMEKKVSVIKRKAVSVIRKKAEEPIEEGEPTEFSYRRAQTDFPYKPSDDSLFYNSHPMRCPGSFRVIGVKEGRKHCAWCGRWIEVDADTKF